MMMTSVKRLKWVWIISLWCVVIVVLLEVGLRLMPSILPPRLQQIAYTVMNGTPYANEWDTAWVRNRDHYFIVKPGLKNSLQYGSPNVSFRVDTIELWDGGGIGFRNRPVDYFVDAVVIGDSFTFCFTDYDDCWVTHLERNTGMGVVNLGQPATGTRSHQLILEGFAQPLHPPLVIWQFFGNDFNDDYGLLTYRGELELTERDEIAIEEAEPEIVDKTGFAGWLRTHSVAFSIIEYELTGLRGGVVPTDEQFIERYVVQLDNGDYLGFGQPYEPLAFDMSREANQAGRDASRDSFEQSKALVESWGGKMVVVLVPTREQVYSTWTADQLGDDLDKIDSARLAMLDLCDELALQCYDPLADLQAIAPDTDLLYFYDDIHFNPYGNAIFAGLVQAWLDEHELLPSGE